MNKSHVEQYSQIPFECVTFDSLFTHEEIQRFHEFVIYESQQNNRPFTQSDFINGKICKQGHNRVVLHTTFCSSSGHVHRWKWDFVDFFKLL